MMLLILGIVAIVLAYVVGVVADKSWQKKKDPLETSLWFDVGLLLLFVAVPMIGAGLGWGE